MTPGAGTRHATTWERYEQYFRTAPEFVLEWNDAETPARGWLVINSRKGGAAGGGTRMHPNLTREELLRENRLNWDAFYSLGQILRRTRTRITVQRLAVHAGGACPE